MNRQLAIIYLFDQLVKNKRVVLDAHVGFKVDFLLGFVGAVRTLELWFCGKTFVALVAGQVISAFVRATTQQTPVDVHSRGYCTKYYLSSVYGNLGSNIIFAIYFIPLSYILSDKKHALRLNETGDTFHLFRLDC